MHVQQRKWALYSAAAMIAIALAGCSPKQESSEAPPASSEPAPQPVTAGGETEHTTPSQALIPASTVPEIWTQIAGEQGKLSVALQTGQLEGVHHLALGIRDLAVALADTAKATTPAVAARIDNQVDQLKTSVATLVELGDAGNRSGAQTEYAKLEAILDAMKSVTVAK